MSRDAVYRVLVQSGADIEVLSQPEVHAAPVKAKALRPAPQQAVPKMLQEKPAVSQPDDTRLGRELAADFPRPRPPARQRADACHSRGHRGTGAEVAWPQAEPHPSR